MEKLFEWTIPSEKEKSLRSLIGCKIVDIVKTSYETYPEYLSYLNEVGIDYNIDKISFFKFSYGGLVIIFDNGVKCHFGSAEDLNSIIICFNDSCNDFNDAKELTFVSNIDNNPFLKLLNYKIIKINILTRNDLNSKQKGLPSENGLEFIFKNDEKIILSHNLTDNNFVFGVLTKEDAITKNRIVKKSFK